MSDLLERIILSWQQSPDHHIFKHGASDDVIAEFESTVGWELPSSWRKIYLFSNGMNLVGGDVSIYPLQGDSLSVAQSSAFLRESGWNIPDPMWTVASNGGGDPFGVWIPSGRKKPVDEVVAIGAIFEPKCLAIAGSDLTRFLLMRTAYYLLLGEAPRKALDTLGIPTELRSVDPNWSDISEWADPDRKGSSDDPYDARLTEEQVSRLIGYDHNMK